MNETSKKTNDAPRAAPSRIAQVKLHGNAKEPAVRCRQVIASEERRVEPLDRNVFALEAPAVVCWALDLEGQDRPVPALLAQPSGLDPEGQAGKQLGQIIQARDGD